MIEAHPDSVLGMRERLRGRLEPLLDDGDRLQVVVPAATTRRGAAVDLRQPTPASVKTRRCLLVATEYAWISVEIRPAAREPLLLATGHGNRDIEVAADGLSPVRGLDREYFVDVEWAAHVRAADEALAALQAKRPWSLAECGDWVRAAPPGEPFGFARRLRIGSRKQPF